MNDSFVDDVRRFSDVDMVANIPHFKNLITLTILKGGDCLRIGKSGVSFVGGYKSLNNATVITKIVNHFRDKMGFILIDDVQNNIWELRWQK
jgi:hypothetical protein